MIFPNGCGKITPRIRKSDFFPASGCVLNWIRVITQVRPSQSEPSPPEPVGGSTPDRLKIRLKVRLKVWLQGPAQGIIKAFLR